MMQTEAIKEVIGVLKQARSILFITGAGISADSGLPTYRGIGGLYNGRGTDEGMPIETALSGEIMRSRPEVTWKYIYQIEKSCRGAKFNRGHEVIAEMERHFDRVWVLTQNIDGFHFRAGSKNVIDIHGDIHSLICTRCTYRKSVEDYSSISVPPQCPDCGAIVRPKVVLFGEMLPEDKIEMLYREVGQGFDAVFSIGTTSVFPYIAMPVLDAKRNSRATIEINPGPTEISHIVDHRIEMHAAEALDMIWKRFQK
jgi:NAD-dependent deacetylase